jgi:predicted DNA-binding transcriptional regulator YafY
VPVYAERGRHGGFALLEGWTSDLSGLTGAEASAVLAAGSRSAANALGLGPAFASGLNKLLATMPEAQRAHAHEATTRILVTTDGFIARSESTPALAAVQRAVIAGRRLRLAYEGRSGNAATRTVDPIGLVNARSVWYLFANHRGELRTYRVSRIVEVEVLADPAQRSEEVDLQELWERQRSTFGGRFETLTVEVELLDPNRREQLLTAANGVTEHGDGRYTMQLVDRMHALGVLWSFGPSIAVVEPAWMRDELLERARAMVAAAS